MSLLMRLKTEIKDLNRLCKVAEQLNYQTKQLPNAVHIFNETELYVFVKDGNEVSARFDQDTATKQNVEVFLMKYAQDVLEESLEKEGFEIIEQIKSDGRIVLNARKII